MTRPCAAVAVPSCSPVEGAQQEAGWWGGYFKEMCAKWQDMRPPHLVGMAVAVAQLVEAPPDRWGGGSIKPGHYDSDAC